MSPEINRVNIKEFDAANIERLPEAPEYIRALVRDGPCTYVDNARVTMKALSIDDIVLPIVISEPGLENSDVCSPSTHYVSYTLEELVKRRPWIPRSIFQGFLGAFGAAVSCCELDRVVYVNNWLLTTNPHEPLTPEQLYELTEFLRERYPDHAIVHRSVNPYLHKEHYDALIECGHRMVKSRVVYLIDPMDERVSRRSDVRRDLRLLRHSSYEVVDHGGITDSDVPRMVELYRSLYLDKHSFLNPQFDARFFSLTLRGGPLEYKALKKGGRIDAMRSFFVRGGVVTGAFVGYDQSVSRREGLFRQLFGLLFIEAREREMLLNWSAGVGAFKIQRGAFPVTEYDAVYDHHLSVRRRLGWHLVRLEGKGWGSGL